MFSVHSEDSVGTFYAEVLETFDVLYSPAIQCMRQSSLRWICLLVASLQVLREGAKKNNKVYNKIITF